MKTQKIKNSHQKKIAIAGTIIIMAFGIIFVLVTISGVENNIAYSHLNIPSQINLASENNPLTRIDQDGRGWHTPEDEEYAKQIIEEVVNRIKELEKENFELPENDKERENNQHQIDDLRQGIDEIQYLGSNSDYKIRYDKVDSTHDHYKVKRDKIDKSLLLKLQYSDIATALHESRHAYQYITEGKQNGKMYFSKVSILSFNNEKSCICYEIRGHQIHYSFDNSMIQGDSSYESVSEWVKKRDTIICKPKSLRK